RTEGDRAVAIESNSASKAIPARQGQCRSREQRSLHWCVAVIKLDVGARKRLEPAPGSALAIRSFNAFSRVRLSPRLRREALRLRLRQHRLPYVIRHMRRPT